LLAILPAVENRANRLAAIRAAGTLVCQANHRVAACCVAPSTLGAAAVGRALSLEFARTAIETRSAEGTKRLASAELEARLKELVVLPRGHRLASASPL